jgi:hypothetical protein
MSSRSPEYAYELRKSGLTCADIRYGTDPNLPTVATLAIPTPTQRAAFELLNATIPLTLT